MNKYVPPPTYGPGMNDYGRLDIFKEKTTNPPEEPKKGKCKQSVFIEELHPGANICSMSLHCLPCEGTQEDMRYCAIRYRGETHED